MTKFVITRIFIILTTLILVFVPLYQLHSQNQFIASLGDVPLMPGLTLVEDSETSLDLPEGRIVEIFATGSLPQDSIAQFYKNILPALGWQSLENNSFIRDNENLDITIFSSNALSTVRFTLSPYSTSVSSSHAYHDPSSYLHSL